MHVVKLNTENFMFYSCIFVLLHLIFLILKDDWKTVVVFAVPNQIEDVKHCHVLSESISTGLRKLFSVIEYDALVKEVSSCL